MKYVWILFIKNQCSCDDDQECIVAFETEELLEVWLTDYCKHNELKREELECVITFNKIFESDTWRGSKHEFKQY